VPPPEFDDSEKPVAETFSHVDRCKSFAACHAKIEVRARLTNACRRFKTRGGEMCFSSAPATGSQAPQPAVKL
jgi:hypothetical protein